MAIKKRMNPTKAANPKRLVTAEKATSDAIEFG
jgi:hypothetical protein